MWELFSTELKNSVDKSVPTQVIKPKNKSEPIWVNKEAKRLVGKHRKTYNKYKSSLDPFVLNKYKEERRTHKKLLHEIEQAYITNKVCKPLESGNSKPFYCHLKWSQGTAKPPMKLVCTDGSYTEDAKKCADMLNDFFGSQFCAQHQLSADKNISCYAISSVH